MNNFIQETRIDNIFPELTKPEIACLLKVIRSEWDRWDNIIEFNHSDQGTRAIAADYEYDSIKLGNFVGLLEEYTDYSDNVEKMSFSQTETAFAIEALDHEFDLLQEGNSSLDTETLNIMKQVREKIKDLAMKEYSAEILKTAHYQRGKTRNE